MRVLLVHNFYQQPGGEDSVFEAEGRLLEEHGHEVVRYTEHNDSVDDLGKLTLAARTIWSRDSAAKVRKIIDEFNPQVVHFHNTLPLISPSAYYAATGRGARIVQTLHNYRFFCPPSLFLRDGKVCELCLGKTFALPAVRHACYRQNRSASAVVASMLAAHKMLDTYRKKIDVFVALTDFSRRKFIEGGFPEDKIVVKPHFIESTVEPAHERENFVLYVGRLSAEKGVQTLVNSWKKERTQRNLVVVGDGPLQPEVTAAVEQNDNISWLGRKDAAEVRNLMRSARAVVVPSECYETFGRVIMEAYAVGTPVVVSNIGAVAELVRDGKTGLLFTPGDERDLIDKVESLFEIDPMVLHRNTQEEYFRRYTPEANYRMLMDIYGDKESADSPRDNVVRHVA